MPRPYASAVINADASTVWSVVRDFGGLANWYPTIGTCEIEPGPASPLPGAVRRLNGSAGEIRERLLALDDVAHSCTYEFVSSPFPVRRYVSTIQVHPITSSGGSFVAWWAEYDADAADEPAMTDTFARGVFGPGLVSLAEHLTA